MLEAAGIPTRLPCDITLVGDVSGGVEQAESWRAIRFLPLVAQRDRRPVQSALTLWLRGPHARFVRYAVITSGERVPLGEVGTLKARMAEHTGNIRRWSSEARTRYGVELVFRGTEFTVTLEGVHLHSNVAYRLHKALKPDVWAEFLSWSRGRLAAHWKDCGVLNNPAEVVKYICKPAELYMLPDEAIVWLFNETYRSKLCQPLGEFAEWLKGLERDRLKVAQVYGVDGKARFRLVTKMERPSRKERPDTEGADLGEIEPVEGVDQVDDGPRPPPGENVICGRTLPQARWTQWAEPVSLVMGYTETPITPDGVRRLALLRARQVQARAWWEANGAPEATPISVHTDRPTVQALVTSTTADGAVFDRDTGELLHEPDPGRLEARQEALAVFLQSREVIVAEMADLMAPWDAEASERAAWARVVENERYLQASGR